MSEIETPESGTRIEILSAFGGYETVTSCGIRGDFNRLVCYTDDKFMGIPSEILPMKWRYPGEKEWRR